MVLRGGICLAATILASSLLAQQSPSAPQLAQRVDHHYNSLHSLKATFSETYEGLGIRRTESGSLLLLKPGRMRWDYTSPAGKLFLLDGKFAWFYTQGDSQVRRTPISKVDDMRSPLRFLLGHTELSKELNHLVLSPAANGLYTLSGQPKGQEQQISNFALTVTSEGIITGIKIEEADGATTRFAFTSEETNPPVPESEFRFTPPAGVPVVDVLPPV